MQFSDDTKKCILRVALKFYESFTDLLFSLGSLSLSHIFLAANSPAISSVTWMRTDADLLLYPLVRKTFDLGRYMKSYRYVI